MLIFFFFPLSGAMLAACDFLSGAIIVKFTVFWHWRFRPKCNISYRDGWKLFIQHNFFQFQIGITWKWVSCLCDTLCFLRIVALAFWSKFSHYWLSTVNWYGSVTHTFNESGCTRACVLPGACLGVRSSTAFHFSGYPVPFCGIYGCPANQWLSSTLLFFGQTKDFIPSSISCFQWLPFLYHSFVWTI